MKPFPSWKHPAGGVTALLLAVAAVSVVALVWMGVRLPTWLRAELVVPYSSNWTGWNNSGRKPAASMTA